MKLFREKRLESNGQIGWRYLKHDHEVFAKYATNSYALTVKNAQKKLLPFVPPCFTPKLFDKNIYFERALAKLNVEIPLEDADEQNQIEQNK